MKSWWKNLKAIVRFMSIIGKDCEVENCEKRNLAGFRSNMCVSRNNPYCL